MTKMFRNIVLFSLAGFSLRYLMLFSATRFTPEWWFFEAIRVAFILAAGWETRKLYKQVMHFIQPMHHDVQVLIEHGLQGEVSKIDGLNLAASWCAGYRTAYKDLGKVGNRPDFETLSDHMVRVSFLPSSPATLPVSQDEQS